MKTFWTSLMVLTLTTAATAEPNRNGIATAKVEVREVAQTYATDAVVEAVRQSTVSAQISGRIVNMYFDVGDRVEKGQTIIRIDEREVGSALAGSQAQVAQAQARLTDSRANFDRTKQLLAQKFVSQAALDRAQADYKAAQAALEAALAGAGQAATTKSFAQIVAPYSGVVLARHVEVGEMATPGKPLMTGFDPSELRVVATVPQYKLAEVRGGSGRIEIPALNRWIDATAMTIQPAADPRTLSTKVRLDLPANLKDVYPGQFVRAHFVLGKQARLIVPEAAVLRRSEVTAVYVLASDLWQLRQVRLGDRHAEGYAVLAGLTAGETVALDPVAAGLTLGKR